MPFTTPGDLPNLGIEPRSPALQADALPSEPPGKSQFAYYLPIGAHLGFCQNLVITNKPAGNIRVEVFSGYKFSNQVSNT